MKEESKNIFIVCGGASLEHDVSIASARSILSWICRDTYNVFLVVVRRSHEWCLFSADEFLKEGGVEEGGCFFPGLERGFWKGKSQISIDMVFPMIHGLGGEDGALQGLCELFNLPYVGCGILGSAVCWDKGFAKSILRSYGIPVVPFLPLKSPSDTPSYEEACEFFGENVLFVKPSMQGSSIGVSQVSDPRSYKKSIAEGFSYCEKVLIEPRIEGDEIECAVLDSFGVNASELGQIVVPEGEFYSYKEKYDDQSRSYTVFPDHISSHLKKRIQDIAIRSFCSLECRGMARVDFFVTKNKEPMVSEINTIPGFTPISLYPKMLEKTGVCPKKLVQSLIDKGLERWHSKKFYSQKKPR